VSAIVSSVSITCGRSSASIAATYKKLRKLQDQQVEQRLSASGTLSTAQERRYKELKDELINAVKSLSLNQNRIDAL
ncbi:hypothetical protein ACCT11_36730, partial [Rhizobium johnstonii]|uniref:hypothetical protein n=1 Tax=Rhizobium johnstonii TaxID=3019933 RepID=UPI003F98316B